MTNKTHSFWRILLECLPLVVFFAVYYIYRNIFIASTAIIIVSWLCLAAQQLLYKKIAKNTWLSTILITIFAGLTISFHNKLFIMLKPTILYLIFASSLLIARFKKANLLKKTLHNELSLDDSTWNSLNNSFAIFFIMMAILNLIIAFNYSEEIWVKFKVFGGMGLTTIWIIVSFLAISLKKHYIHKKDSNH